MFRIPRGGKIGAKRRKKPEGVLSGGRGIT